MWPKRVADGLSQKLMVLFLRPNEFVLCIKMEGCGQNERHDANRACAGNGKIARQIEKSAGSSGLFVGFIGHN